VHGEIDTIAYMRPCAFCLFAAVVLVGHGVAQEPVWPVEKAQTWYQKQPWLVGANFLPSNAINQLEMWQAATFDPKTVDRELGWAEQIGMNTMRVYLHDLAWKQDREGFKRRVLEFLAIASRHNIRPVLVFFDSCWDPYPKAGPQRAPKPGVHNSGWVQSPGAEALASDAAVPELEAYIKDVVGAFRNDSRILAWDLWNEPDNDNRSSYGNVELKNKSERVQKLLPMVFQWAREARPSQPLTSGVWVGDWSSDAKLTPIQRTQLGSSDIITFHNYENVESFQRRIRQLERYGRPMICTEYLARGAGSTFQAVLPAAKKHNIGMINWGLVQGKSQTHLPWDSWQKPYVGPEPAVWHHEIFQPDGSPYRPEETEFLRKITGRGRR